MNAYYRSLVKAGVHPPNHVTIWISEYRGRKTTYIAKGEELIPLEVFLKAGIAATPAEIALVVRELGGGTTLSGGTTV